MHVESAVALILVMMVLNAVDAASLVCCMSVGAQAIENTNTRDYVTEKVYDALAAGCVPIYWGARNVRS